MSSALLPHSLNDNRGREYAVHYEGTQPSLIIFSYKGKRVGYIELMWSSEEIEITNLEADQRFRRCGLGSQMFEVVKQFAIARSKARIRGIIRPTDRENVDFASLCSFYTKQGCIIKGKTFILHLTHR